MDGYGPSTYGDNIAEIYDDLYQDLFDVDATVTFLASFARGGRALELGIGTGRIALPLKDRGVEVHGVDSSEAMVAKMRAKPGGKDIPVQFGDIEDPPADGLFDLVYIPFNTLFGLTTQESQIRCFANVTRLLDEEGVFVFDAFVPDMTRWDRNQRVSVEHMGSDWVMLDTTVHDPVTQSSKSFHTVITDEGNHMYPVQIRYAWPSELDLMARLAGLQLQDRFGSYARDPFTAESKNHVSVYERA